MTRDSVLNHEFLIEHKVFDLYDSMISDTQIKIPDVLQHVAEVLCQYLNAERATIFLIDKATYELESAAFIGNVSRIIRIPINDNSLAGFCALSGRAFVVPDAYGDLSHIDLRLCFDKTWDTINQFRTRDVMCAPAFFKKDVIGVAEVMNSKGTPFSGKDLPGLQNIRI